MSKSIVWLIVIVVIIVGAVMLMSGGEEMPEATGDEVSVDANMPVEGSDADEMEAVQEFTLTASNFEFDMSEITVKKGETVKLTLVNSQGTHDLQIDGYDAGTKVIQAGEQDTVTFTADQVGEFEFFCSVGNHRQMGMVGKLIVTE